MDSKSHWLEWGEIAKILQTIGKNDRTEIYGHFRISGSTKGWYTTSFAKPNRTKVTVVKMSNYQCDLLFLTYSSETQRVTKSSLIIVNTKRESLRLQTYY